MQLRKMICCSACMGIALGISGTVFAGNLPPAAIKGAATFRIEPLPPRVNPQNQNPGARPVQNNPAPLVRPNPPAPPMHNHVAAPARNPAMRPPGQGRG